MFTVLDGGSADTVEIVYSPAVSPITLGPDPPGIHLMVGFDGNMNTIDAMFHPSNMGMFTFTFETPTLPPINFSKISLLDVENGQQGSLTVTVTSGLVPEPASVGLLGIGMTSLLAWRRLRRWFRG
jgi:hypothetical protein